MFTTAVSDDQIKQDDGDVAIPETPGVSPTAENTPQDRNTFPLDPAPMVTNNDTNLASTATSEIVKGSCLKMHDSNEYLTAVMIPTASAMSSTEINDGSNSSLLFPGHPNRMKRPSGIADESGIALSSQGPDTKTKRARFSEEERDRYVNQPDEIKRSFQVQKSRMILHEAEAAIDDLTLQRLNLSSLLLRATIERPRPVGDRAVQILECLHIAENETAKLVELWRYTKHLIDCIGRPSAVYGKYSSSKTIRRLGIRHHRQGPSSSE
ncbi:unnamed protein product [Mortierella alpina]